VMRARSRPGQDQTEFSRSALILLSGTSPGSTELASGPSRIPDSGGKRRTRGGRRAGCPPSAPTAPLGSTPLPPAPGAAAGFAAVESRHASWLNSLVHESLVPDFAPVEAPIDQSIVLSRVTGFVNDPRSTFPSFDTTVVSDANNFAILDFILFLEYIEAKFYMLNVPRFAVIR
jgi:hypothetical protein